ncbi:MAG: orotidine-5'-phosphate decarboxylase [Halobacteriota archaeon]
MKGVDKGIVHALDVEDKEKAFRIADDVKDYVQIIKISYPLVIRNGADVIKEIKQITGLPVLACFKIADIPEISRRILNETIDKGADAVTLHGFVGRKTLEECINLANERGVGTFVVTEMSHKDADYFLQDNLTIVSERIAEVAAEIGATGIIAPATRPHRVRKFREIIGTGMKIVSPGVGAQGGSLGDAILAGADFEIVGRSIYTADNPREKAKEIYFNLQERLKREKAVLG